jgi:hypothetical protein
MNGLTFASQGSPGSPASPQSVECNPNIPAVPQSWAMGGVLTGSATTMRAVGPAFFGGNSVLGRSTSGS